MQSLNTDLLVLIALAVGAVVMAWTYRKQISGLFPRRSSGKSSPAATAVLVSHRDVTDRLVEAMYFARNDKREELLVTLLAELDKHFKSPVKEASGEEQPT